MRRTAALPMVSRSASLAGAAPIRAASIQLIAPNAAPLISTRHYANPPSSGSTTGGRYTDAEESPASAVGRQRPSYARDSDAEQRPSKVVHEIGKNIDATMEPITDKAGQVARQASEKVGRATKEGVKEGMDKAAQTKENLKGTAQQVGENIKEAGKDAKDMWNAAKNVASRVGENVKENYQAATEGSTMTEKVGDMARSAGETIKDTAQKVGEVGVATAQYVGGKVGDMAHTATEKAKDVAQQVTASAPSAAELKDGMKEAAGMVGGAFKSAIGSDTADAAKTTAYRAGENVKDAAKSTYDSAKSTASNATANVKDAARTMGQTMSNAGENFKDAAKTTASRTGDNVKDAAKSTVGAVGAAMGATAHNVSETVKDAGHRVADATKATAHVISDKVGDVTHNASETIKTTTHKMGEKLPEDLKKHPGEAWWPMSATAVLAGLMLWWGYTYLAPGQQAGIENAHPASQTREGAKKIIESAKPPVQK